MAEKSVPVRFLLGPAGSGKTFRCLAEIRNALRADPGGPPLLLLAPKQATFQLERQLLADAAVSGYARLHIFSFERLAESILRQGGVPLPPLLSDQGRVMVLRALLSKVGEDLEVFHATARLPGFARQLSEILCELEQHGVPPQRLRALASELEPSHRVRGKLVDLAVLLTRYDGWLKERRLEDSSRLLALARDTVRANGARLAWPWYGGLWLDGFAEMTPQELDLLAAVVPCCAGATLAFCLAGPPPAPSDSLSPWSLVGRTFAQLRQRLAGVENLTTTTAHLADAEAPTRFGACPVLHHLERHWAAPRPFAVVPGRGAHAAPIRLVRCPTLEVEAITAARAVLRFVREEQGRFREAAVLVRSLEGYHAVLRRVFARYEIPIFLDRREGVTHHPLTELTRSAVRLAAFGWQTDDWMSLLKTGLAGGDELAIDRLENAALAHGWNGEAWLAPLPAKPDAAEAGSLERLRQALVPPLARFTRQLKAPGGKPTGPQLAEALRGLWAALDVDSTLARWSGDPGPAGADALARPIAQLHATVWRDLQACLDHLALAFAGEALPLREWLAILEAGLSSLTVGVIPPVLDHVLVGAVDRSRNPDLKFVVLLGWNDGVFPAPIPPPPLLTESERLELQLHGLSLGPDRRLRIGRERYYAYIAATRARQRVLVTFAERDGDDHPLNPSPFVAHLRRLFPDLVAETASARPGGAELEHAHEAVVPWLRWRRRPAPARASEPETWATAFAGRCELPALADDPDLGASLAPALADRLYGPGALCTSVSRLEQFAACPFRFFVHSGLRAGERERFEVDVRQAGSFQHAVLARFHAEIDAQGLPWRALAPVTARALVARVTGELLNDFAGGLFRSDARRRFEATALGRGLQDLVEVVVGWMRETYAFDPSAAEFDFGGPDGQAPAWELDLGDRHRLQLRGKIDRIDLAPSPDGEATLCVVIDYKSSERRMDRLLLEHGIQMQLPVYLAAFRALGGQACARGRAPLEPAGMFYVNLRGGHVRRATRGEIATNPLAARRESYRHRGRFSLSALPRLDRSWDQPANGGQFSYARGGRLNRTFQDPLPGTEFAALLDQVEQLLKHIGSQIFSGSARVSPYLKGRNETACQTCLYWAVCRFDPWLHEYRRLTPVVRPEAQVPAAQNGIPG